MARRGSGWRGWLTTGCQNRKSFTRGRISGLPSNTQGGSRMREFRTYGSVRGAFGNGRPYRDQTVFAVRLLVAVACRYGVVDVLDREVELVFVAFAAAKL